MPEKSPEKSALTRGVLAAALLAAAVGCSTAQASAPSAAAATAAPVAATSAPAAPTRPAAAPAPVQRSTFRPGVVAAPPATVNPDQLAQEIAGAFQAQVSGPPDSVRCPPLPTAKGSAVDCTAVRAATTYVVHVLVREGQGWQTDLAITIARR